MASFDYGAMAAAANKGFEPLPAQEYEVEVTGAEYKPSANGKPMYKVEFTVESGPNKGRKIWTNLVLSLDNPNAVAAFFGKMRNLGLDAVFFASLPASEDDPHGSIAPHVCQKLISRKAKVTTKHREWQGQTQNEVTRIVARAGSAAPAAADPAVPDVPTPDVPATAAVVGAAPAQSSGIPDLPPGL